RRHTRFSRDWSSDVCSSDLNPDKKETFMKMFELQAGLGIGVKKFKVIFVFDNERAFNKFVNSGWEFGAQSDAAVKAGEGKGASEIGRASCRERVEMGVGEV